MKARVFLQMRLKEDNLNIELTPNKRPARNTLVPPTAQRRRRDSSSSSSSSSSSESDIAVPPPPTEQNEEELRMALLAINAEVSPPQPAETESALTSTPIEPTPTSIEPTPTSIEPTPTPIEPSPTQPTSTELSNTQDKTATETRPKIVRGGIKSQGRKWDHDTHVAAVSQTIQVNKLIGKIKTQEATIKSLNDALEKAQRQLIESKLDREEVTQLKERCTEKDKEYIQMKKHFEDIIRTQHNEHKQLIITNVELKEKLSQRTKAEEEERNRRKDAEWRLSDITQTHTQETKSKSFIHVPHYQNIILSEEVSVSNDITDMECVANEEIACIHLYAEHSGVLTVQHMKTPSSRPVSERTKQLIANIKAGTL